MQRLARFLSDWVRFGALLTLAIVAPLCGSLTSRAWAQGTGRSLDIQPGARQNGMGAAGVALLGDPSESVWWNPASLGFARTFSATFTYAKLVPGLASDVHYYHGAAVVPVGSVGAIGLGYTYLSYGESYALGPFGQEFLSFGSSERAPSVSIGVQPVTGVGIGATLKVVRIELSPFSGKGEAIAVDAGGLYRFPFDPASLSLGFNFQNLGPRVSFSEGQNSPLSQNLKVGAAVDWPGPIRDGFVAGVAAAADFNHSLVVSSFNTWHGGVETYFAYPDRVRLALRAGWYYDKLGEINDWTFGFGARLLPFFTADAAWIPQAQNSGLERVLKLTAGVHSGWPRVKEPDSDDDGVPDSRDKSPDTPKGVLVDAFGVPIDTDGDGIFDGLDRAPNTPRGVLVDLYGMPLDTDHDSVFDGLDQCPNTPGRTPVDERGCPRDGDGDGVADGIDACADTPSGAVIDERGCPRDQDRDGVPDGLDRCAATAEGARVDATGCPVETPVDETTLIDTGSLRLEAINFESGSADLPAEALPRLDEVATILAKWSELKIEIAGHSDSLDSEGHNLELSRARAQAVLGYLTGRYPNLDPGRFVVAGYGEGRPLVPNDSPDHMARNRRVEFTVLNREALERPRPAEVAPAGR